jgi:hypothetical protein
MPHWGLKIDTRHPTQTSQIGDTEDTTQVYTSVGRVS